MKVSGGTGNDTIKYNINAPVDVDGGSGFNTLVLLGTEANDTFVITKDGIFGGGLNVAYTNIQAVTVDALEGDDTFYVLSTPPDVVTTLIGGTGGDTFVVGGDVQGTVVSANSKGASGVVDHSVTSTDPNYKGIFVDGIGLTVGGAAGALIQQDPLTIVHANDPTSIASFVVTMPQTYAFSVNSKVYVNVSAAQISSQTAAAGGKGVELSLDGTTWTGASTATLAFNASNWTSGQRVYVRALAGNLNLNKETIAVSSTLISNTDPSLDALRLPIVKVFVENTASGLIIDQGIAATTIIAGQTSYSYTLSLNKQPAVGETVNIGLAPNGLTLKDINGNPISSVSFDHNNYNVPQTVVVSYPAGSPPAAASAFTADIVHSITSTGTAHAFTDTADAGDVKITVAATNTPGVLILQPQGDAAVSKAGQTYTYQMVLTEAPTADVTVNVLNDGQTFASVGDASIVNGIPDPRFNAANQTVTFNASNWYIPISIKLSANLSFVQPTDPSQASTTVMTFPN